MTISVISVSIFALLFVYLLVERIRNMNTIDTLTAKVQDQTVKVATLTAAIANLKNNQVDQPKVEALAAAIDANNASIDQAIVVAGS